MTLERYREMLHRCYKCQYCRLTGPAEFYDNCPSYIRYKFETFTGGGRVWVAKGIYEKELELGDQTRDILFACPTCGSCMANCFYPIKNYILGIIETARSEAVQAGVELPGNQKAFGIHLGKEHNPYLEPHTSRLDWLPAEATNLPDTSELLYFVGCTSSYRQKVLAQDTVKIFTNLSLDFTIMKDEWCCASPLLRTGQWQTYYVEAAQIAQHNLEEARKIGAKRIVTTCAGCYRTWKKDYMEDYDWLLGSKHEFEVFHTTQFLLELINKGELNLTSDLQMKVAYHDPCHLGRHMGEYEAPRKLLKKISGLNLVELPQRRENAWCCGSGGGVKAGYSDWAVEIAYERIKQVEELGVEAIVSACPFCWRNLDDAIKQYNSELKIYDIIELVRMAMGL